MIFVTHDQAEALSMGDRMVVLSSGRVLQTGTPEDIYWRPVSPSVAKQIGQPRINIFSVTERGGMYATSDGLPLVPVPADHREKRPMLLGVRPEDITLGGGEHPAEVELVEDTGPAKVVVVRWGKERVYVLVDKNATYKIKDRVFPRLYVERVILWSA
jgi:ABC-type sugar transport system ATPase subunit